MNDIIFISLEEWYAPWWRRNKFLVAELARSVPDRRILFVDLPVNVSYALTHLRLNELRKALWGEARLTSPDGFTNVQVLRPVKLLPNSWRLGRAFNEWFERVQIRRAAKRTGLRPLPLLWINSHFSAHLAGRMRERAVIYDITDDWTSLTQTDFVRDLIVQMDTALCKRADAVIVCSQRLAEMKRGIARRLELIPNGVDAAHYRVVLDGTGPLLTAVADWKTPVLGYTGTIHNDRVDLDLVEHLSRSFAGGTIALVGPVLLSDEHKARLAKLPNVVCTGPVPYQQLPEYMRAFDVAITPHVMTPFTESLNPIKLWEFLAAGKPIVSTDVAGFRDYPQYVQLARDANGFDEAVHRALVEDPSLRQRRRDEVALHTWKSRAQDAEAIIASVCAQRTEPATPIRQPSLV
jgi:teichuronic acid biosynthesis glycosyltransferase TuaH